MKKIIAMFLALAMVIGWVAIPPAHAHAEEQNVTQAVTNPVASAELEVNWEENLTFALNKDGKSYCVSFCDRTISDALTIPATYNGLPVTAIGRNAFGYCDSLTGVTIPDSVTTIGEYAFGDCKSLTSVTIPNSVTTIGEQAFDECTSLTTVTIPDSVTTIGARAFLGCSSLTSVTVGNGVTTLGKLVFYNCGQLNGIWVNENNPNYSSDSNGVLFNKDKTTLLTAPGAIVSYVIPDSVTTIDDNAFGYCDSLSSVTIPDSVTTIGESAFYNCASLTTVTIPDSVTTIGDYAFYYCSRLTSVAIPDSVTTIGEGAFKWCSSLTSVTIPNSVTQIPDFTFEACTSLTDVYFGGTEDQWNAIEVGGSNFYLLNANITFLGEGSTETTEPSKPEVEYEQCLSFELNKDKESYRVSGCTEAFTGALTIPDTYCGLPVTAISYSAFYGWGGLTSVVIPDSVTEIWANAFCECSNLTSVAIPDGVTIIGQWAFGLCKKLTSITIPDGITTIEDSVFEECDNLSVVTIPGSVTAIKGSAFYACENLTDVYYTGTQERWDAIIIDGDNDPLLNANITFLGESSTEPTGAPIEPTTAPTTAPTAPTFEPTTAPTTAPTAPIEPSWPEAGWENGLYFEPNEDGQSYRVYDCVDDVAGELTVPATYNGLPVTTIGDSAFSCCYELTGVVLPESITVIGSNAFANCHNLQSVNLPDGLVAIAEYAFASCDNLYEIQIPANVEYIGAGAFGACPLTGIWVDENNPNYANDDKGVLFSKDMTFLAAAPYGLTGSYAIPDGVAYIGANAFSNTRLSEVTFPDSVTEIGNSAFQGCYLTEIVIGNGVVHIGLDAFANCEYLTAVTIPNSVIVIADYAFQNSPNVTFYCHVGAYAATYADDFNIPVCYLDAVKEVSIATMPEKLVYPLDGHLKLAGLSLNVTLEDGTVVTIYNGYTVEPYDFSTAGTKTVTVSVGSASVSFEVEVNADLVEYPESDHPYQNFSNIVWKFTYPGDADILEITFSEETMVEDGCDYIYIGDSEGNETRYTGVELAGKKLVVPGKIFTIRLTSDISLTSYGFAITSIEALKKVGTEKLTFALNANGTGYIVTDCDEAAEGVLDIPAEYEGLPVEGIGENAFQNCAGLTGVTIAEGIAYIGNGAFGYCGELKEITIPVSITAIGDYAFLGCDKLTDVYYKGNRSQWNAIQMGEGEALSVKIHFSSIGCEHIPGDPVVVNERGGDDCFDTRYQDVVIYCADCDIELEKKTVILPPRGHTPGEPVIENEWHEGGCTGNRNYQEVTYCTECYATLSRVNMTEAGAGHTEGETILQEMTASCTYNGYREWQTVCADCGYIMKIVTEEVPATGHTPGRIETQEGWMPSCVSDGYCWEVQYCANENCELEISRTLKILPATGHVNVVERQDHERDLTCTSDGIYWNMKFCMDCGRTLSSERVVEKATGHTPGETFKEEEWIAGCENAGHYNEVIYCADCGMQLSVKLVIVPPLGHTEEIIPGYAATCTEYGMTDGKYCTICGMNTLQQQWINPLGHTEEIVPGYAATCTNGGMTDGWRCTVCGETTVWQQEIPALGHTVGGSRAENIIKGSCTQDGYFDWVTYCVCGEEMFRVTEVVTAMGHEEEIIPGREATENQTGLTEGTKCSVCGEILLEQEEIPALTSLVYTLNENGTGYIVSGYLTQYLGDVNIPATFNGLPVVAIGNNALQNCGGLTSVSIPSSVTSIGEYAFYNCDKLTAITIAESVTAIEAYGISYCDALKEIHLPSTLITIGNNAFAYDKVLLTMTIPEGVTSIGDEAFRNCKRMASITLPTTLTSLGYKVFSMCDALASIRVTEGNPVFSSDSKGVLYGENMTKLIRANTALAGKYVIPNGVLTIEDFAFADCTVLTDIVIADSVTIIGECAFSGCSSIETVTMGIGVTSIGKEAFRSCTIITDVYYNGTQEQWDMIGFAAYNEPLLNATLHLSNPCAEGHTYDHDFDAVCNACFEVRDNGCTFDFANYRVVFTDGISAHKNIRAILYKLGDQTVADPTNETALKAIDKTAVTYWGAGDINDLLITDAGNYVLLLKYNVGTGSAIKVPLVISVSSDPKLIIDKNNKLTMLDDDETRINHRIEIYYLGDQTVEDITDADALKALVGNPEIVWKEKYINATALTKGGNYVVHLCYNIGTSSKMFVAQQFNVFAIPTLKIDVNNRLNATDENAGNINHRLTIFYLGENTVENIYDESAVKAASISSRTVWGLPAINNIEILEGGNYVFHLYYNVGTGAKRTLAVETTLTERPKLSVSADNKLVVSYSDPEIKNVRAYIYKVDDAEVNDIYDEAALKKLVTPTQVWGLSSINNKQLTAQGTYVIHLYYSVGTSAKKTVALKITIGA